VAGDATGNALIEAVAQIADDLADRVGNALGRR
jgi:hypothetical protein